MEERRNDGFLTDNKKLANRGALICFELTTVFTVLIQQERLREHILKIVATVCLSMLLYAFTAIF